MYTEATRLETEESSQSGNCGHCGKKIERKEGESVTRFRNRKYCDRQCSGKGRVAQMRSQKKRICQVVGCTEQVGKGLRFLCSAHYKNPDWIPELAEAIECEEEDAMEFLFNAPPKPAIPMFTITFSGAEYKQDELEFYRLLTAKEREEIRRSYEED